MISAADTRRGIAQRTGATVLLPLLFVLLAIAACTPGPEVWRFEGDTMGTTYHVTVVEPPRRLSQPAAGEGVDAALQQVNALMSTYRPESEVSRFNAAPPDAWFAVSPETLDVVETALEIHALSAGAFDITVGPLVDLWGFGAGAKGADRVPSEQDIARAAARVGSAALSVRREPPALRKSAEREIDLSAIAKGYGVDRAALWLEAAGVANYMVEVGGEVRTAGNNPDGHEWRIGIEAPELMRGRALAAIAVSGKSIATSGDYRNYFERDGKRYSHTIDPATARPIEHGLASVTVVAQDCKTADALATAIDVLGPARGMELAEREQIPVYMLVRVGSGFESRSSTTFQPYLDGLE
ncbi:MAG: FAD:protein FMN transferase [Gammaproteobacteria bacterium]|jgi:thiamine biosynthesis lipoprotein|nr:FAD:protein FMN transferase [Gammaproteobacteria bacterium]MBK7522351.1 FAD:protein FMN transferase [Gammaproteobacteria bacterium]